MTARTSPTRKLAELGIELPAACQPAGNYRPALISGEYLYVSGHTPDDAFPDRYVTGKIGCGKVGVNVTQEEAYEAARATGLAILSTVQEALGSLSRVKRLVRATGLVNCVDNFTAHPKVMDGFSDLMAEVFGKEKGIGARSATGASSLPNDVPVEVSECIFEIYPARKLMKRKRAKR